MNRLKILLALSILFALAPLGARGATSTTGPVNITARELRYNREQNIYTAEGDVLLTEGNRRLNADFVLYNDTTKDAFAEGHVVFQDLEDVIHGEKVSLNLVTNRGTIEKGQVYLKKGNFFLTGNEIEKTGESTYKVHQGQFTTCGFDHPDWIFNAKDVDVTVGGYATTTDARFSVFGQPVLFMPWGIFPVKTERQSGFLLPDFVSSSSDGFIVRNAYFWAIAKDKDATFFLDWIQDRGVKPGAEYRYNLSDTTKGRWYGSILDDMKYDHTRYQVMGEHQQLFGDDLKFKADINHVSDFDYLEDLGLTTIERSESSLRSVAFAEKPLKDSLLSVESDYFQDLTQKSNSATLQYLPEASYFTEYIPIMKQKAYADLSSDLTNFMDGTGDRFTRFVAAPSLHVPYSLSGFNFLFSEGLTEKAYSDNQSSPNSDNSVHHETYTFSGDANAQFVKNGTTDLFNVGQYQSVISPHVDYSYIKNDESFGSIPSLDPSDRTSNANVMTYSFDHYFNAVKDGSTREISLLEIEQSYGLSGNLQPQPYLYYGNGNRLSDVHARLTFIPQQYFYLVHEEVFNIHGQGVTTMTNSVHYVVPSLFQMDLTHSYSKEFLEPATEQMSKGVNNEILLNTITKWRQFDLRYQLDYSFLDHSWIDTLVALTYHPSCWGITLTLSKTRRPSDTSIHLSFNLQGLTQNIGGH